MFKKIEQSIDSYSKNAERKKEQKKLWLNSTAMTLEDNTLIKSNEDEKVDEKGGVAELSLAAVEKNASADLQADSIQVSEKTESDSSTSVETEKSDD
jgi:hypothetical protein